MGEVYTQDVGEAAATRREDPMVYKVNAEALMIAAGQNIKRLLAFRNRGPGRMAQVAALRPPGESYLRSVPSHRAARDAFFNRLAS